MPVNIQLLLDSNKPISYFLFIHIEASCILVSPKIVSNTFDALSDNYSAPFNRFEQVWKCQVENLLGDIVLHMVPSTGQQ